MRTTRFLLAAVAAALVAACSSEPTGIARPDSQPAFDGVGFVGSGNAAAADSTFTSEDERCGAGLCGSGN